MNGQHISVALLSVGVIALGATQHLGTPWAGVMLCGLSVLPWGLGAWLGRAQTGDTEDRVSERRRVDALVTLANEAHKMARDAHERIETQGEQIGSLRSTISARGVMGG